jgi:site-specific DNA recombinase
VDQVRCIGKDAGLLADTLEETRARGQKRVNEFEVEKRRLERDLEHHNHELRELAGRLATNGTATDRVAALHDRIRATEQRATQVREELIALGRDLVDEKEVARVLSLFDPVWETLSPREQVRVIRLLVQRVDYDGENGTVSVTFHPAGIKTLVDALAEANAWRKD